MEPKKESAGVERCEVVVDSNQVENYSQRGYRTIEIREEDVSTTQFINTQEILPNTSYPTQITKQVPVTLRVLRFHMVKDGGSRIAELTELVEAMRLNEESHAKKSAEHDKTIAGLKSSSESLTRDIERRRADLEKELKLTAELRERLRKMEGDIAKFRKEIGEQRWREITSDAQP
jgi:hypothetical protein